MGATEILASYAANLKYEDLPEPVVAQAKRIIMDTVGSMIGGVPLPLGNTIVELAQDMGGGASEATIVGSGAKVSCVAAAYANGALSDVLDWNDMLYVGHPATAAVGAGLAMAEKEGATGKQLIEAVVAAYEVFGRVGICVQPSEERQQALWGMLTWIPFNSAIAAGKILRLDGAQMATAIGTAGAFAPLGACWKYVETRSDTYHYNHGMTAMSGLFAAMHAQKGLTGMNTILEGPTGFWVLAGSDQCDFDRLDALLTTLGKDYWIMQTLYKRWPANLWVQSYLDVFTDLMKTNNISPDDIAEINVSPALAMLMTYRANGTMDAAFSLAYALAVAAYEPEPGTQWYADENMHSPKVLELVKKVKKADGAQDADLNHEFRNYWNGYWMPVQVEIVTTANARHSGYATYPKGHRDNPMSHDELKTKFRQASASVLEPGRMDEVIATIENLEDVGDIGALAALLH